MPTRIPAPISTAATAAAAACVLATAGMTQNRSVSIDTRFVDYDNPEEVTELYNIIVETASDICSRMYAGSRWRTVSPGRRDVLVRDCTAESVDSTIEKVDQPELNEVHAQHAPVGRGRVTILVRE